MISHPQAEGLKAGATINVLAAAFLSGHLEGFLQLWILERYLMAERQQARLRSIFENEIHTYQARIRISCTRVSMQSCVIPLHLAT